MQNIYKLIYTQVFIYILHIYFSFSFWLDEEQLFFLSFFALVIGSAFFLFFFFFFVGGK